MAGFGQYLKDTQTELNHVAWPTRTQTVVYTLLVLAISVGVAVYLGFFDFVFTTGLKHILGAGAVPAAQTQNFATSTNPAIEISTTTTQ